MENLDIKSRILNALEREISNNPHQLVTISAKTRIPMARLNQIVFIGNANIETYQMILESIPEEEISDELLKCREELHLRFLKADMKRALKLAIISDNGIVENLEKDSGVSISQIQRIIEDDFNEIETIKRVYEALKNGKSLKKYRKTK